MEVSRGKGIVGWSMLIILMMMMMMTEFTESTLHKVGSQGWIPNYNYTEWSSQNHFYVGDWLMFVFDKHMYNVLEVNETSYQNCSDQGFIKNITRGGRDVFQLTEARPYYFLCGGGYCWNGMKAAINVEEVTPAPAPEPTKNGSPSNTGSGRQMVLSIACYAALACSIFLRRT